MSTSIALESSRQSLWVLLILILCGREIMWDCDIISMLLAVCYLIQPRGVTILFTAFTEVGEARQRDTMHLSANFMP